MNKFLVILTLSLAGVALASAEDSVTPTRSFQQYSALMTWGDDTGLSWGNWGVSARSLYLIDGTKPEGFYYTLFSGAILHSVDSIPFADLRIVGLGWRGNPVSAVGGSSPLNFSLDFSLAPTAELRLKPHQIALDSANLAMGATFGIYVPIGDLGDLGVSWEPVIDLGLWRWGNPQVSNKTYSDFAITWVVKAAHETKVLPWKPEAR